VLGVASQAVDRYAELLERLIRLAPPPAAIRSLAPKPPWVAWDHPHGGVWPPPDDRDADLNAHSGAPWLDDVFNAKKASLDGGSWLDPGEAAGRLRRAGA
jgi:hypothetical protein